MHVMTSLLMPFTHTQSWQKKVHLLWQWYESHCKYIFGYTRRCSKHLSNTLSFSTGRQDSIQILMAFASDFIWRKSLSWQLLSFKLFIFLIIFLWFSQMIAIYVNGISLWSCFIFLVSMQSYILAHQIVTRLNLFFGWCFLDGPRF